jgi:hypothetical protein
MSDTFCQRYEIRLLDQIAVFVELDPSPDSGGSKRICITNPMDISANGIHIVTEQRLPVNGIHQLYVDVAGLGYNLMAEVSWLRSTEEDVHIGGILHESEQTDIEAWKNYICERLTKP